MSLVSTITAHLPVSKVIEMTLFLAAVLGISDICTTSQHDRAGCMSSGTRHTGTVQPLVLSHLFLFLRRSQASCGPNGVVRLGALVMVRHGTCFDGSCCCCAWHGSRGCSLRRGMRATEKEWCLQEFCDVGQGGAGPAGHMTGHISQAEKRVAWKR
jgi:hypothetical protein